MDQLASLIGYAVIGVVLVAAASYVMRAVPEFWRVAGWRGATSLILGFGGFVWAGYALAHKNEVSSGQLLFGLVVLWGAMIFVVAAGARTRKGRDPERASKRTTQAPSNVDTP